MVAICGHIGVGRLVIVAIAGWPASAVGEGLRRWGLLAACQTVRNGGVRVGGTGGAGGAT